tara:strand:+ start:359 stop:1624 length:1266 start_codon:yes stop_codon:yes gene_type:complete
MEIKRNAKFWGLDTKEIDRDHQRTIQTCRRISKYLRQSLVNGDIVEIKREKGDHYVTYKDGSKFISSKFKYEIAHLFDEDACSESLKRCAVKYVLERYIGYLRRNGKDRATNIKSPISISDKSFYFKDNFIKIDKENKTLYFKTMYTERGEFREVPYKYSLKEDRLLRKKFGGNYSKKQNTFIAAVDFDKESAYVPECFLGFDINKDQNAWIWFNDGTVITPNAKIKSLIKEIKKLNDQLDKDKKVKTQDRVLRSSQRRPIRLKWIEAHRKLESEISKVCAGIVDKTIQTKSLLCIDSVKTGQKMGTFGQEHIIKTLQTMCENKGVPFYVVPCKDTSRRCASCGYVSEKNRTNTDDFCCVDCGYKCNAQQNGADNVTHHGTRMYNASVPYKNWTSPKRRSVDSLVEEYSQQQSSVDTSETS